MNLASGFVPITNSKDIVTGHGIATHRGGLASADLMKRLPKATRKIINQSLKNYGSEDTIMKKRLFAALGTSFLMLIGGAANAAVISSLSFTSPAGTVGSTDSIEVWATLTVDPASDEPLTYDGGSYLGGLPTSLIPTEAEVWNPETFSYDYTPFGSYDYVGAFTSQTCSGTFTSGCSDGEYHISANTSGLGNGWFDLTTLNLAPGQSQDFLLYVFTPTDGSAAPGEYTFYNMGLGFTVHGLDADGNAIEQDILFGATCVSQSESCAFTRTVVSAVPVPAAVWLFGSGLLGLVGIARRKVI